MGLAQIAVSRMHIFAQTAVRSVSTKTGNIKKTVLISQSTDVFTNLALEEWLYRNVDFTDQHILMLWQNDPCVVIGIHENPWFGVNISRLPFVADTGVPLARRISNGCTFYQDKGNLNMTFFTPNYFVNRKHNLELIARAIFREYGLKLNVTCNEDLVLGNSKVSINAAHVGCSTGYHQCMLSVSTDKILLDNALQQLHGETKSNAPTSVTSELTNLCSENSKISVKGVLSAIGWEYMRTPANVLRDGGKTLAYQQNGFQLVNPTEQWFPGLKEIRNGFISWDWCYGKTPKFTVTKFFPIPDEVINGYNASSGLLSIKMVIEQGKVSDILVYVPPGLSSTGFSGEANVITSLKDHKFTEDVMNSFEWSLLRNDSSIGNNRHKIVSECVRQIMTSV